jgi:hypothetical protein
MPAMGPRVSAKAVPMTVPSRSATMQMMPSNDSIMPAWNAVNSGESGSTAKAWRWAMAANAS